MTSATINLSALSERAREQKHRFDITPAMRALTFLEKVAHDANELGRQGHRVKEVQLIEWHNPVEMDTVFKVRLVPEFNLRKDGL